MARRSLKPQLNQIRTWVRQGRTDAWIAHQLEASVRDISNFKREHELEPGEAAADAETDLFGPTAEQEEIDLRAEDEALVAAALEEEAARKAEQAERADEADKDADEAGGEGDADGDGDTTQRRRRGRRGGRGGRGRRRGARKPLEGTFDHGEDGYGLWLDPAVQDDPVYAEHWAGHRTVTVTIEAERIVIERSGGGESGGEG